MSFILDALKKLEQEKAARRKENINISDEILRGNHRVQRKGSRSLPVTLVVAALAIILVVAAVVAGALLWRHGDVARESQEEPGRHGSRRPAKVYPEPSPLPAAARAPESPPLPAAAALPRPNPAPAEPRQERRPAHNPAERTVPAASGERVEESYQGGSLPAGSDLKVSGIAWQEKRSARRAVVNGLLVPEGTSVGGATVKEIFQNRVRFLSNGRTFDLSISGPVLGDSTQPAPTRQPVRDERPSQGVTPGGTASRTPVKIDRPTTDLAGER